MPGRVTPRPMSSIRSTLAIIVELHSSSDRQPTESYFYQQPLGTSPGLSRQQYVTDEHESVKIRALPDTIWAVDGGEPVIYSFPMGHRAGAREVMADIGPVDQLLVGWRNMSQYALVKRSSTLSSVETIIIIIGTLYNLRTHSACSLKL